MKSTKRGLRLKLRWKRPFECKFLLSGLKKKFIISNVIAMPFGLEISIEGSITSNKALVANCLNSSIKETFHNECFTTNGLPVNTISLIVN